MRGERSATDPDPLQDALDRAYRHLARRDRTEREIRDHLERGGVPGATIDEAVRILSEFEYLDDARFAVRFTRDKRELEAWGAGRIERRLTELGVDRDHIRAALAGGAAPAGEAAATLGGGGAPAGDATHADGAPVTHAADAAPADAGFAPGPGATTSTERDRALALLRRRFPAPPEDRRSFHRALGVLLRKGYDPDVALEALAAYSGAGADI